MCTSEYVVSVYIENQYIAAILDFGSHIGSSMSGSHAYTKLTIVSF